MFIVVGHAEVLQVAQYDSFILTRTHSLSRKCVTSVTNRQMRCMRKEDGLVQKYAAQKYL